MSLMRTNDSLIQTIFEAKNLEELFLESFTGFEEKNNIDSFG